MILEDKLNQHIQQTLEKPSVDRITVEVEETFGGGNQNFIEVERELLISMEYAEGMLIIEYFKTLMSADRTAIHTRCVEMISKDRIKRVSFDEEMAPSRLPFEVTLPYTPNPPTQL